MKHATERFDVIATTSFDPRLKEGVHPLPLTEAQREIWVSAVMSEEANAAFNISSRLRITGPLNLVLLQGSARMLMERHVALRSRFSDDGTSFQIAENSAPDWISVDAMEITSADLDAEVERQLVEIAERSFDLENGPLLRLGVVSESDNRHHVVIVVHHIVGDGWSVQILLNEFSKLYNANAAARAPGLKRPDSYSQFALRNALIEKSEMKSQSRAFWHSTLDGLKAPARLPRNLPAPSIRTYNADSIFRWLDDEVAAQLLELGRKHNASLFTTLFALYAIWMGRLSGNNDVVIGVPVAGQPYYAMPDLVGHCVNLLPYRYTLDSELSFESMLGSVQSRIADGYEHQTATFGEILKDLNVKRDASEVPLVPVTLNVVSAAGATEFLDCESERIAIPRNYATFELILDIYRDNGRLQLEATYNKDLFCREVMLAWLDSFETLARFALANPSARIADMSMLDASSNSDARTANVDSQRDYNFDMPIAKLIDRRAESFTDKPAISGVGGQLTYAELVTFSNQVARHLTASGSMNGKIVGVLMERQKYLPAILLGIHKSGGAYLPIDPAFPEARRKYMLQDSGATTLVTESRFLDEVPAGVTLLDLDEKMLSIQQLDAGPFEYDLDSESRAYVIYTSGSTGNPKGVEISHRNMVNFLLAMEETPGLSEKDRLLAVTSLSFDISVLEMFLPLICGATLVIATSDESADGFALKTLIDHHKINVMQATPSTWRVLIESGWRTQQQFVALCGGEPMPTELIPELLARGCALWNMYGPTETTVWSSCTQIHDVKAAVSIGRPIANTSIHILDAAGQAVPVGVSGEICIGGAGVAIGYLGRPELTAEKFFSYVAPDGSTERLYRTGDLGFINVEGLLFHQGRLDFQVKLRGYRIELGEIEARLAEHPDIEQVIVDVWAEPGSEPMLTAYIRSASSVGLSHSDIRAHLVDSLPAYMIPQHVELLDSFPLTPNGKVDRKQLRPSSRLEELPQQSVELNGKAEELIADVWQKVIGGDKPGRFHNFFEFGGHSLLAIRAIGEIQGQTGVAIPMHMFALEELREIAAYVDASEPVGRDSIIARLKAVLTGKARDNAS